MKIGLMVPNYARWFRDDAIWDVCLKAKELGVSVLEEAAFLALLKNTAKPAEPAQGALL